MPKLFYRHRLVLTAKPLPPAAWAPVFTSGILLEVETGHSLGSTLVEQIGIDAEYVIEKLQTVFLNSSPVDDLEAAMVAANDVIALSAAMPGMVGATLRRGGHLAAMRREISRITKNRPAGNSIEKGLVTVKLFNLACRDLAIRLAARGIILSSSKLTGLLGTVGRQPGAISAAVLDGRKLAPASLGKQLAAMNPATKVKLTLSAG